MWIALRNINHFVVWLFHPLHEVGYKIFQIQVNVTMGYALQLNKDMLLKVIFN